MLQKEKKQKTYNFTRSNLLWFSYTIHQIYTTTHLAGRWGWG